MRIRLSLSLLFMVSVAWAQFEEFDDNPSRSGASTKDDSPFQNKKDVSSSMIRKLADARKSKSEDAVVAAASEILAIDADHKEALNTLAVFYFEAKKYGLAKILLRRALKTHPDEAALHNNLGIVYLAEEEPRLALDSFRKSLQVSSGYRLGATNLASIYLEHRDYTRSLAPLEQSYRSARSDLSRGADYAVEIANNYAIALMGVNENRKAEDVFEAIAKSGSRNPIPFLNYAILLTDIMKKKKDAIRILSKLKFMTEDRKILKRVQELEKRVDG